MSSPRRNVLGALALLLLCSVLGWRVLHRQASGRELARLLAADPMPQAASAAVAQGSAPVAKAAPKWVPTVTLAAGAKPRFTDAKFTNRLRNTAASADELNRNERALLLRNAFVDTASSEPLPVPAALRSLAPGAYLVQAHGAIDAAFRARLDSAGAKIIGYMPRNAFLVQATAEVAEQLASAPETAAVLAYEAYYKLEPELLARALTEPARADVLKLILTVPEPDATLPAITALGGRETFRERGPFGTLVTVEAPGAALVPLAQLSGVHLLELWQPPVFANDRTGFLLGSSTVPENTDSYTNLADLTALTGDGVLVNVNDSGIDSGHPDLANRVFTVNAAPQFLRDEAGHGTHVAGIIAGNGSQSATVARTPQGSVTNASFKGKAPRAELFVLPVDLLQGPPFGDTYLQETAASTRQRKNPDSEPLISNNSWGYRSSEYGSHSASFDAAARDALPGKSGDQPILYVFSAGNTGRGGDNGQGGDFDSINTPGNAKNVITVGALEALRELTNAIVTVYTNTDPASPFITIAIGSTTNLQPGFWPPSETNENLTYETNYPFAALTDSEFQVASYSSRGNVGIGTEGESGRFKPDVVVPGTFILSTRSAQWRLENDYPPDQFPEDYTLFQDLTAEGAPYYRYETGTSMAAPAVAGLLAQMQEFFQKRPGRRPSAAGYKALLLNSAEPTSPTYFPDPKGTGNYGGWGQPDLPRALTSGIISAGDTTGLVEAADGGQPVGLATGESRSYRLDLTAGAASAPLRITLVWTDPPGNPAGASKLVNDLDLVVSNTVTGEVIYGNDFEPGAGLSAVQATNDLTRFDRLNNVERIVLDQANGTNFVVSVVAYRVNVNTRTDHPNAIVQDFALAFASGAPAGASGTAPGTLTAAVPLLPLPGAGRGLVVGVTNGGALFSERVGANAPLINGRLGQTNQWRFYTFTNLPGTNLAIFTTSEQNIGGTLVTVTNYLVNGSNVAFVTFPVGNLSRARTNEPDIDLYVSRDPALTNLVAAAVTNAFKSTSRGATELVFFTNSPVTGEIYYVGVKSEDQEAAEYGFIGISTDQPLTSIDGNGLAHPLAIPLRQPIPDGTPARPGTGLYLAISILPGEVRSVTPRVTFTHQNFPDLLGNLSHARRFAVLNNHGQILRNDHGTNLVATYDDLRSGDFSGSVESDGPGSLLNFIGEPGTGPWFFATSDNALGNVGRINGFDLGLRPNDFGDTFVDRCVRPGLIQLEVINVPADASKLTVTVTNLVPALPLEVFIRREAFPDLADPANNDRHVTILPPGGEVTVGVRDLPPLQAGRYFIAVYNPNAVRVCYRIRGRLERDLDSSFTRTFTSGATNDLTDRALSSSLISIDETRPVTAIQVGVRIDHPRESDLAIRLVNPAGARALLVENRGLTNGQGFGGVLVTTNRDFAHVALTFERSTGRAVLYVNGRNVAEELFPDYVPRTTNAFFFGIDPTAPVRRGGEPFVDDFALWGGALRPGEVENIYRYGLDGYGQSAGSASSPLISLWPFDVDGRDAAGTNDARLGLFVIGAGQIRDGGIGGALQDQGLGLTALNSSSLDVATGRGFTLDGWVKTRGAPNVAIAGWGDTNGLSPGLFANQPPPFGNGPGSVTALLSKDPLRLLKSPAGLAVAGVKATNTAYAVFTDLTNRTAQMIKFAEPPFITDSRTRVIARSGFNVLADAFFTVGKVVDGWTVVSNVVQGITDPTLALDGDGLISLAPTPKLTQIRRSFPTIPGRFYTASFGYRRTPFAAAGLSQLELLTGGRSLVTFNSAAIWQTNAFTFQATSNRFVLDVRNSTNSRVSTFVDSFRFIEEATGLYLPEEPLKAAALVNATGDWQLEVTDARGDRTGRLLSWQITLTFAPTNTSAVTLTNAAPFVTNVVGGDIRYFIVEVPPEAVRATNFLQSLTGGPLNLLFGQDGIPDGTQPSDYTLLSGVTAGGTAILTTNLPPVLEPGQRYYLGVQNAVPGSSNNFEIRVDFDVKAIALTNGLPYEVASTNDARGYLRRGLIDYYSYDISTNAIGVRFALGVTSGDLGFLVRRGPSLPTRDQSDHEVAVSGGQTTEIVIDANGLPVPLTPGRWYLGVYSAGNPAASYRYSVLAEEVLPIVLTNRVPRTDTLTNSGSVAYYAFDIRGTNATSATFSLTNLSGNVDLYLRKGLPLPGVGSFDYAGELGGTNDEQIIITPTNAPVALGPGRWFLAVVPVAPVPLTYTILAELVSLIDDTIIDLADSVALRGFSGAGALVRYRFIAPPGTTGLLFELYDLDFDADLSVAKDVFPSAAPAPLTNFQRGPLPEVIVVRADAATPDVGGTYHLEVKGVSRDPSIYTIRAATRRAGLLIGGQPIRAVVNPGVNPGDPFTLTFNSIPGETYRLECTTNLFASPVGWQVVPPSLTAIAFSTTVTLPPPPSGVAFLAYRVTQIVGGGPPVVPPPIGIGVEIMFPTNPGDPLRLSFNSVVGATYQVESTDDLVVWNAVLDPVIATGTTTMVTLPAPTGPDAGLRAYRVRYVSGP